MLIKKVEIELESICPLLMDKFITITAKTPSEYKEQSKKKVYTDEKGNPCIESRALKACIREASSELGKKMMAKKNRQAINSGIFFDTQYLLIGKKKFDCIREDIVSRIVGKQTTRVITYRPQFNNWKIKSKMNLIGIEPSFVQQAIEIAGLKYGLYGYRPERGKGDFGRFVIKSFKVVK
jgi:hypothetical protein